MAETIKIITYTPEIMVKLLAAYNGAADDAGRAGVVEDFANTLGVKAQSVRGKLVREEVYIKPTKTSTNGGAVEKKADIVERIAKLMGKPSEVMESLEKATKPVLQAVEAALLVVAAEAAENVEFEDSAE